MKMQPEVPVYQIRGLSLLGWQNMQDAIDFLFSGESVRTGTLVAINAEKILAAERDPALLQLIAGAEFKYADGISIVRSIRKKYPSAQLQRIAGADLWEAIMQRAGQEGTPVFLIGGKENVLARTEQKLRTQWGVNIVGSQDGYFTEAERDALFDRVQRSGARIVTVAMGSPRQESVMRDCQKQSPDVLYMGVGGTYDVFTGHVRRAPLTWQRLGLEWLYRLLAQPTRLKRQLKLLRYLSWHITGKL